MELSKELAEWVAEEEAKWAAEVNAEINAEIDSNTPPILPPTQPNPTPRCWDHGCKGRKFANNSNLHKHQREWASRSTFKPSLQSKPCCWDHGCNGRLFSTNSNLYRHQREYRWKEEVICSLCNTRFTPAQVVLSRKNRLKIPQCWEHGCHGRVFSEYSTLYRHQRNRLARQVVCSSCSNI